jgi:hypothetical protein
MSWRHGWRFEKSRQKQPPTDGPTQGESCASRVRIACALKPRNSCERLAVLQQ